ncbi:MAG: hypothetical protein LBQ21_03325 [Clostridiales Family XIII bacterium]|jgi:hypothetical protein|nr:hypothetical protein [Clostridiales Family XIII bacterium]
MGILNGFPFITKEERVRREQEFNNRVFPLGVEQQRDAAALLLSELIPEGRTKPDMLLFTFIVAKDAYMKNGKGEPGETAARRALGRVMRKNEREKALILSAIKLEAEITSMDDYPTAEEVLAAAETEQVTTQE